MNENFENDASNMTLPLRISENLLAEVAQFGKQMITVYLGLCQFAYGEAKAPSEEAKARAATDLRFLNQALSSLGAHLNEADAQNLLELALTPGREWGKFKCISRPTVESVPDGLKCSAIVSDELELPDVFAHGLFGLAALQQLTETNDGKLMTVAAEMVVRAHWIIVPGVSVQTAASIGQLNARIRHLEEQIVRAKGTETQRQRALLVKEYARRIADARKTEFRNQLEAANRIQASVREYARSIQHPLGMRIQTITDMLKGINFGIHNDL